jgi:hypothetical protein
VAGHAQYMHGPVWLPSTCRNLQPHSRRAGVRPPVALITACDAHHVSLGHTWRGAELSWLDPGADAYSGWPNGWVRASSWFADGRILTEIVRPASSLESRCAAALP